MLSKTSGGSRGDSGGSNEPPSPHIFKYPMEMKQFAVSETKLFHFHGKFKKNEINQKREPCAFINMNTLSRNPGPPL